MAPEAHGSLARRSPSIAVRFRYSRPGFLPLGSVFVSDTTAGLERRDALQGILAMLLCVVIFGVMDALVKLAAERRRA